MYSPCGDYLLPLLQPGDVPVLRKLFPDSKSFQKLENIVRWTYGIQRGGVPVTEEPCGQRPVQVVGGRSLAVAWAGVAAGWLDLDAVEKRPYGKLSLWRKSAADAERIFVAEIGLAPFASVSDNYAAVNTVVVGVGDKVNARAVAVYINSKLARFYWAQRLRSGVIQGYYSHIYPRTLEDLPWPVKLSTEHERRLEQGYNKLAMLAVRAKDNPNEWLLGEAEQRLAAYRINLSDPALGLRFAGDLAEVRTEELDLSGHNLRAGLFEFAEFGDTELAEYVYRLLSLTGDEDTVIKIVDIQKLVVPRDYGAIMTEYRKRVRTFARVESDFLKALSAVDEAVYDAFEINAKERAHIEKRLSTFPLNRLKPRYPWETVKPRPIKAYMEDRFN